MVGLRPDLHMSHEVRKNWRVLLWFATAETLIGGLLISSRSGNADEMC